MEIAISLRFKFEIAVVDQKVFSQMVRFRRFD